MNSHRKTAFKFENEIFIHNNCFGENSSVDFVQRHAYCCYEAENYLEQGVYEIFMS